jgi:hypothetical protein
MTAYRFLLHRKPSLPLFPSRQQNERNTVQQIARTNGFPISPIQSINSRIEHALQHPNSTYSTPKTKIWTTFTYHGALIPTVSNSLKHTKLHMTFRTTNTIFNLLIPKSHRNEEFYDVLHARLQMWDKLVVASNKDISNILGT